MPARAAKPDFAEIETDGKENQSKKKGLQNVTIPEALFNVAIRENHFQRSKSRVDGRLSVRQR